MLLKSNNDSFIYPHILFGCIWSRVITSHVFASIKWHPLKLYSPPLLLCCLENDICGRKSSGGRWKTFFLFFKWSLYVEVIQFVSSVIETIKKANKRSKRRRPAYGEWTKEFIIMQFWFSILGNRSWWRFKSLHISLFCYEALFRLAGRYNFKTWIEGCQGNMLTVGYILYMPSN